MYQEVNHYLHAHNQKQIVMVDPAVAYQPYPPYQRGADDGIFLRRDNGSFWVGVVWPGVTVFPDCQYRFHPVLFPPTLQCPVSCCDMGCLGFLLSLENSELTFLGFHKDIQTYWNDEFSRFFSPKSGIDIDGLWIDMNEPSNFPCNFPCSDPYAAAVGFPPEPPPVRSPPRPLPGFPCPFQPAGCGARKERREFEESGASVPVSSRFVEERQSGKELGLPGRNLLYPKYAIKNAAGTDNGLGGGISNHTVNTDVIHQNGLAEYDTHNLYGTSK